MSDSIYDAPNPDAPEQQPAFVLQRPPGQRSNLAHLLWATLVAVLLFFALCSAVAGGALLGGVGGALLALAVSLAYVAHLIDSA